MESKEHVGRASPACPAGRCASGPGWALEGLLCVTWVIALAGGGSRVTTRLDAIRLCSPVHRPLLDLFLLRSSRQEKAHNIFNLVVALRNLSEKESIEAGGSH